MYSLRPTKILRKTLAPLFSKSNSSGHIISLASSNSYSISKRESNTTSNKSEFFSSQFLSKNYTTTTPASTPPTTFKLDLTRYELWTKEEIFSLLCLDKDQGGAGLSSLRAKPIYQAGFDGFYFEQILSDIMQKEDAVEQACKTLPNIPRGLIRRVVAWVNELLRTKLYNLWDNHNLITQMRYNVNLSPEDILKFESNDYNGKWICKVIENANEAHWPNLDPETHLKIENWLKSLERLEVTPTPFLDVDYFVDRIVSAASAFGMLSTKANWGTNGPPFVNRRQSILQTIACIDGSSIKPTFPIISTSRGMGKTTFLLSFARKFLADPTLMYEYIFDGPCTTDISLETLKEIVTTLSMKERSKVEFINKLYRAINSGHFIALEPITAKINDQPDELLEKYIMKYMEKMFVGAFMRVSEDSQPTIILSLQNLFSYDTTIPAKLKQFSHLIRLNAPRYYENLLPQSNNLEDALPLLILVDSFHLMNFDQSNKGTLFNTCTRILEWKLEIPMLSLIISANSLPNQFKSKEQTLFFLKSINLELLIGNDIFNEIIFDLYGAYLNGAVLKDCFGDINNVTPIEKQLSPYLTRVILSMLYMCSGNGRAIERVYKSCNHVIQPVIEKELSMNYQDRITVDHADVYNQIWRKCRDAVQEYVLLYPESLANTIFTNETFFKLVRIMGLFVAPDYIFPGTNLTIEELQKLGLFVKFRVNDLEEKFRYGGSFMMLDISGKVDELKPISASNSKYFTHLEIEAQWLLQPYSSINILPNKKQGDYFEQTIASSIWARYNIACIENNIMVGDYIDISQILPSNMIPTSFKKGLISLKGVVKLNNQFDNESSKSILPRDRVIINANQSSFSDLILPVKVGGATKFIGFQTKYLKEGSVKRNPYAFIDNAINVLSVKNFAFVHISTFISELLQSFPDTDNTSLKKLAEHKDVKFASCENLVSVWWFEIMYKHNPQKKVIN